MSIYLACACHIPRPSHPHRFHHLSVQTSLCSFLRPPVTSPILASNILLKMSVPSFQPPSFYVLSLCERPEESPVTARLWVRDPRELPRCEMNWKFGHCSSLIKEGEFTFICLNLYLGWLKITCSSFEIQRKWAVLGGGEGARRPLFAVPIVFRSGSG